MSYLGLLSLCRKHFQIEIPGGETVGEITKKWRGFFAEALTDSDTFKIDFPGNIEVSKKALLVGATMLLVSKFMKDNLLQGKTYLLFISGLHFF